MPFSVTTNTWCYIEDANSTKRCLAFIEKYKIVFKVLVYVYRWYKLLMFQHNIHLKSFYPVQAEKSPAFKQQISFHGTTVSYILGKRCFASAAPRLWNKFPDYIKTAKSLLKTFIMKSQSDFFLFA